MRALGRNGKPFEADLEGLLAICVQHEIDHLDGKLFVDYLSEMKRQRVRKKLEKDRTLRAEGKTPATRRAHRRSDRSTRLDTGLAVVFAGTPALRSAGARGDRRLASPARRRLHAARPAEPAAAAALPASPGQAARARARPAAASSRETLNDAGRARSDRGVRPDVMVVVAYGLLLPPAVLALPRLGCLNMHASLAAALARRGARRARDPGGRRRRPASASCAWKRGSTPGR